MRLTNEKLELRLFELDREMLRISKENSIIKQELVLLSEKIDHGTFCSCRLCVNEKLLSGKDRYKSNII